MKANGLVHVLFSFGAVIGFMALAKEFKDDAQDRKIYYVYRVWANNTEQFDHLITIFKSASKYHVSVMNEN